MSDPTLIADLVRAGVDPELIGRVSSALLNVRDNVRDTAVREYETGRKRNYRKTIAAQQQSTPAKANDVAGSVAENVPPIVPDNGSERCDLSSFLSSESQVFTEEGSKKAKKERSENARERGTRMQAGAVLSDGNRAAAIELGAAPDAVDGMWAEFVDYWTGIPGQRGTKVGERGWSGTWRNRLRAVLGKPQNGYRASRDPPNSGNSFLDVANELRSRHVEQPYDPEFPGFTGSAT